MDLHVSLEVRRCEERLLAGGAVMVSLVVVHLDVDIQIASRLKRL